jgi:hypothetical protein
MKVVQTSIGESSVEDNLVFSDVSRHVHCR